MALQLTVISLDFESEIAPFTKVYDSSEITLGRSPSNDVVLDRPEVSGKHLRLRVENGASGRVKLYATDLGSLNGTLLENELLDSQVEQEIRANQRLIIGPYLIQAKILDEDATLQEAYPGHDEKRSAPNGGGKRVDNHGWFSRW